MSGRSGAVAGADGAGVGGAGAGGAGVDEGESRIYPAERAKAFIDASVAIAMTLLILPLLEGIGEAADEGAHTGEWIVDHSGQLISFAVSLVIIAMFWIGHFRLFARVERLTVPLLWIQVAWTATIVWLPVATALTGQMADDAVQKSLYIGSMIATSLCLMWSRLYLRAHPELHEMSLTRLRAGLSVDLAMTGLFVAALIVAVLVPRIGYFSLFLLGLIGPVEALIRRALTPRG